MHHIVLIHKYLLDMLTEEENRLLQEWLDKDPSNKEELEEIKLIWEASEEPEMDDITDEQFHKDLRLLERSIEDSRKKELQKRRMPTSSRYVSVFLAAVFLTTICFVLLPFSKDSAYSQMYARNTAYQELILVDSSQVVLNDSSAVTVSMSQNARETSLTGEAYFQIRKDQRPFIIHARDVTVRALGTSFIVKCYPGRPVEVYVISGDISVEYHAWKQKVSGGEKAIVHETHGIATSPNNDPNFSSWYSTEFVFDKTELRDVLRDLERHYKKRFYVGDSSLLSCRFTGRFNHAKLQEIISILSYTLDLSFIIEDENTYRVGGPGCK